MQVKKVQIRLVTFNLDRAINENGLPLFVSK